MPSYSDQWHTGEHPQYRETPDNSGKTQLHALKSQAVLQAMIWRPASVVCVSVALLLLAVIDGALGVDAVEYNGLGKPVDHQDALMSDADLELYKAACPDYTHYSAFPQYV